MRSDQLKIEIPKDTDSESEDEEETPEQRGILFHRIMFIITAFIDLFNMRTE